MVEINQTNKKLMRPNLWRKMLLCQCQPFSTEKNCAAFSFRNFKMDFFLLPQLVININWCGQHISIINHQIDSCCCQFLSNGNAQWKYPLHAMPRHIVLYIKDIFHYRKWILCHHCWYYTLNNSNVCWNNKPAAAGVAERRARVHSHTTMIITPTKNMALSWSSML